MVARVGMLAFGNLGTIHSKLSSYTMVFYKEFGKLPVNGDIYLVFMES